MRRKNSRSVLTNKNFMIYARYRINGTRAKNNNFTTTWQRELCAGEKKKKKTRQKHARGCIAIICRHVETVHSLRVIKGRWSKSKFYASSLPLPPPPAPPPRTEKEEGKKKKTKIEYPVSRPFFFKFYFFNFKIFNSTRNKINHCLKISISLKWLENWMFVWKLILR